MANPLRLVEARYDAGFPSDYHATPPRSQSADAAVYSAGERLRDWARYLAKNSSTIIAVLDSRQTKGIGCGLRYEPMVRARGRADGKQGPLLEKLNDSIRRIHDDWSKAADVTGELSRVEVERSVWRDWDVAGEAFARKVYRGRTAARVGYQVQLIPSELVPYGWLTGQNATMGIERDEWGAPLRYWVYPYDPATYTWAYSMPALFPAPVPAENIIHLRRQGDDMGCTRGVSLLRGVIFRVSDVAKFQEAHRRAARASANLFASRNRTVDFIPSDPSLSPPEEMGINQAELDLSELQMIDWLKPGESINFHSPSHPNQSAVEFVNQEFRIIASSCRVDFASIANVFDRAFAALRVGLAQAWMYIYEDRAHFVRDFALPALYVEPLKIAMIEGRLPARELRRADPRTLYDVLIEGPVMDSIDPKSDREAAQIDQEQGWQSRQGNVRRFGNSPSQVDAEREQDASTQDEEAGEDEGV